MRQIFRDFIEERERSLDTSACAGDYIDLYLKEIQATTDPTSSFYQETGS